jgi:hypothetical protein
MVVTQYFAGGGSVMTRQKHRHDDVSLIPTKTSRNQKQLFLGGYINLTYEERILLEQSGRSNFGPLASRRYRR